MNVDVDTPATVGNGLSTLVDAHEELEPFDFDEDGALRASVHVLKNHEHIHAASGLTTPVHMGDELGLFTSYRTFGSESETVEAR